MNTAWDFRSLGAPAGWDILRVRDLVTLVNGYPFSSESFSSQGDIPLVRIRDLLADEFQTFIAGAVPPQAEIRNGDVVIGMDGDFNVVVWQRGTAALNQRLCLLRPQQGVDIRFVAYALPGILAIINDLTFSTTVKHLSSKDILAEQIPVPPLEEQRRIVDFLDAETARIDRLKAARERQIAVINELAHTYVSDYLVPGSVSRPAGKLPWTWLPVLPADRSLVRLGYICGLQNGLTIDSARNISSDVVTRPYLRVANVQAGHLSLDSVTEVTVPRAMAERSTLKYGDVLMTEGGDLDKLGRGTVWRDELPNCLHQNHVFALRPDQNRLDGDYLALLTQSLHGRCYFESTGAKTTNLASTNSSKILDFPVPLPSVEIQRDLVRRVRDKLRTTTSAIELLDRQLSLLAERRRALITAAVTGQLDVTTARGVDVS